MYLDTDQTRLKRSVAALCALLCLLFVPMVSLAAGETETSNYATDLAFYAGAFSTAITASVNPSATMAILSILGAIENAALYSPDSVALNNIADFLNGIPILREIGKLPISNPYAAVFLTLIAAALIVIHSFATSKMVSEETIDKLEKYSGYICTVAISLLPFVTNDALAADPPKVKGAANITFNTIGSLGESVKAQAPGIHTYVLAGITVVAITIFYYCLNTSMNNAEVIIAAIPVKGTSFIWQIIKGFIHIILVLLQLFAPVVSLIVSIHLAVAGLFLFRFLSRTARYYKDIYVYTILRKIFKRNSPVTTIEKHFPRRLRKYYPSKEIAISLYTFHGVGRLPKRSRVWLIKRVIKLMSYIRGLSENLISYPGKNFAEVMKARPSIFSNVQDF